MIRPSIRKTEIEEREESQFKGPENIFNKFIEEKFPNLKDEMSIKVQEAYRYKIDWSRKESPLVTK